MTEVERLNKWLKDKGLSITGQVLYRLVWSNSTFEHRYGIFNDFTSSELFIRQVKETRLVRKYNYINERWILEKWAPGNLTANRETPDAMNGDYIPVYVFETKDGKYLAPTERALKFILDFMNGMVEKDREIPPELQEQKEIEAQVDSMMDAPEFRTTGPTRNAVAYTKGLKNVTQ